MDIQFLAVCQEEGIEREVAVTIDSSQVEVTLELLLEEFNKFCKSIGFEPKVVIDEPKPEASEKSETPETSETSQPTT